MTTSINQSRLQLIASQDLIANAAQFKAVTFAGAVAATTVSAAGILWQANVLSFGIAAIYSGITKAIVGAAVGTPGYPLKVTTSGFLIAASSGDMAIGRLASETAAASGDLARVMVDFSNFGYSTSA